MIINYNEIEFLTLALEILREEAHNSYNSILELKKELPEGEIFSCEDETLNRISLLDNVLAWIDCRFTDDVTQLEITDEKFLKIIAVAISSFMLDVEQEIIGMYKHGSINQDELKDYKDKCTLGLLILERTGLRTYYVDCFIELFQMLELYSDTAKFMISLNRIEINTLLEIFNHISDHETWMYNVFNGVSIKRIEKRLSDKAINIDRKSALTGSKINDTLLN